MTIFKPFAGGLLLLGLSFSVHGQQATVATGGEATGSGGTVSYSIGQVAYTQIEGTTGEVNLGVQQPYEIYEPVGLEEPAFSVELNAFPNPTMHNLVLALGADHPNNLRYELLSEDGKLLGQFRLTDRQTQVKMDHLASATYYIRVTSEDQLVKTFKIIKN
ncbi:MAG: T9SS type A sorting domain-containing protein [Salibacteraceae bacterium]